MTAPPDSAAFLQRPPTLDRTGALELAGILLLAGSVFTLETAHLVRHIPDGGAGAAIAVSIGALLGLATAVGAFFAWRRAGGRPAQRLGRSTWRTGTLPAGRAQRLIVLRDLERRDRRLAQALPAKVTAVGWAIVGALQIAADHSVSNVIVWIAIFAANTGNAALRSRDRRRRPELQRLISRLRTEAESESHV